METNKLKKQELHAKIDDSVACLQKGMLTVLECAKVSDSLEKEQINNILLLNSVEAMGSSLENLLEVCEELRIEGGKKLVPVEVDSEKLSSFKQKLRGRKEAIITKLGELSKEVANYKHSKYFRYDNY